MQQKKVSNQFLDDLIARQVKIFTVRGSEIHGFTLLSYDQYNYIMADQDGNKRMFHKHAVESIG